MDEKRQSVDQPVTQSVRLPIIESRQNINNKVLDSGSHLDKNRDEKLKNKNMTSDRRRVNTSLHGSESPEVAQQLTYPLGLRAEPFIRQYDSLEYSPNTDAFSRSNDFLPEFSQTTLNLDAVNNNNLLSQSFNQNATTYAEPYYLENFHDLASCSCDMDCFEPEELPPKRTFKRPDQFLPYITPQKYSTTPRANFTFPKFHRNRVPHPWGIPFNYAKKAPQQTKYPLPIMTYPYTFMYQAIFKHYDQHEKGDMQVSPDQ